MSAEEYYINDELEGMGLGLVQVPTNCSHMAVVGKEGCGFFGQRRQCVVQ